MLVSKHSITQRRNLEDKIILELTIIDLVIFLFSLLFFSIYFYSLVFFFYRLN